MSITITIQSTTLTVTDIERVIVIPDIALQEAGYIKTFSLADSGHAKHEYHALAQMAYFQYQDDELKIVEVKSSATIRCGEEQIDLNGGLVVYRDVAGGLHILGNGLQNRKKLLEAAYRYCTRWVRLDI